MLAAALIYILASDLCYLDIQYKTRDQMKPLFYLSTFLQSKLCRMTTGGAPEFTSGGGGVPDRQGVVNAQHRPSAKSAKSRIGEVKYRSEAYKQTQ